MIGLTVNLSKFLLPEGFRILDFTTEFAKLLYKTEIYRKL